MYLFLKGKPQKTSRTSSGRHTAKLKAKNRRRRQGLKK